MQLRLNAFVDYLFWCAFARVVINKVHNKTVQKDGMTKSKHGYGHMHTPRQLKLEYDMNGKNNQTHSGKQVGFSCHRPHVIFIKSFL